MSPERPAVELQGISRRFGARWALRGVNLSVDPGEVIGVMGHNGSGKSTLLRVVSTALRSTLGSGMVFGHDLRKEATEVRRLIGFLAHNPGNYDDLTASENLRFAAVMSGRDQGPVAAILERIGLSHVADERARGYSAGMQRRLSLGRLFLSEPKLLLLDEPYNNFDPAGIALVNDLVSETRKRGGSVLIVLHDRRQASHLIDRDVTLNQGVLSLVPVTPVRFDAVAAGIL